MNKFFESELPEGYKEVMTIDAKDKKVAVFFTVGSTVGLILIMVLLLLIHPINFDEAMNELDIVRFILFYVFLFGYIVLHELTHGLAYKIMTKHKLTFGLTLTVAYCGVPDIFVYRKCALISLLAPFTVFNIVFIPALFLVNTDIDFLIAAFLLSMHISGCIGDLYDSYILFTKLTNPATLMNDTGPKQTFYLPEKEMN